MSPIKLFLKKLFTVPLYVFSAFVGLYGILMVLLPFNLPYLLKVSEETMMVVYFLLSLVFVSVVAVWVRIDHCRKTFALEPDGKPLFLRVLTFREYILEMVVFALLATAFNLWIGITSNASIWPLILVTLGLTVAESLAFALVDCLIWMISAKRAHKR